MFAWMALCLPAFVGLGVCTLFGRRFERWQTAVGGYALLNLTSNLLAMLFVRLLVGPQQPISAASFALDFTVKYTLAACVFAAAAALLFEALATKFHCRCSFQSKQEDEKENHEKEGK